MSDEKSKVGLIKGVLVYAKIAQPDNKYESEDTEYSVGVLVTEDEADAWEEEFSKQKPTKFKATDFKTKFKFDMPEQFEGEKWIYQVKLKKDAVVDGKEANPQFRPKVFLDTDDERIDITESRLIANGSVGTVSYRSVTNKFGKFAYLNNILIDEDDFIEYESTAGQAGDEFGGGKTVKKEEARKEATEARKPKKEAEPEPDGDGDELPARKPKKEPVKETKVTTKKPKAKPEPEPEEAADEDEDVPY